MIGVEAYLRDSFYKGYRLDEEVPLEAHLTFHLNGNNNLTQQDRLTLRYLLSLAPHKPFPAFVTVALMIDLVICMLE